MISSTTTQVYRPKAHYGVLPASHFTCEELTKIYNDTRADYIVPMPMNVAKMQEYIHNYDVDLRQSVVAVGREGHLGLAMLGRRENKTWITRLGVTPKGRKKGVGRRMMDALLANSRQLNARLITLEVIKDNEPAHRLFKSYGFETTRELLVIRRPPILVAETVFEEADIRILDHAQTLALLKTRSDNASWVTATESMANAGGLAALKADFPGLGSGWIAFQNSPFQLSRVVLNTEAGASPEVASRLLHALHQMHSLQDTTIENLAAADKHWPVFQAFNYLTSFVRIEMELDLVKAKSIAPIYRKLILTEALATPALPYS